MAVASRRFQINAVQIAQRLQPQVQAIQDAGIPSFRLNGGEIYLPLASRAIDDEPQPSDNVLSQVFDESRNDIDWIEIIGLPISDGS